MKRKSYLLPLLCLVINCSLISSCSNEEHVHEFVLENTDEIYLKSAATCAHKAEYYYSCSCGEHGDQTFEYGEKLEHKETANYICDMVCPECGEIIKKLEPTNEYLAILDAMNYKEDSKMFYESLSEINSLIEKSKSASEEELNSIINSLSTLMNDNSTYFENLCSNYSEYIYSRVRGGEYVDRYNELNEIIDDADNKMNLYVAHLFFSPLRSVFFDEEEYDDMEPYFQYLIDCEEGKETESQIEQSENELRYIELYKTLLSTEYSLEEKYPLLKEYVTLDNELYGSIYHNAFKNNFYSYYGYTRTMNEEKAFRENVAKYLVPACPNATTFTIQKGFSDSEKATLYNDIFENEDNLRDVIAYFKTLKNDEINLFDKANNAFKEGRVFAYKGDGVSCVTNGAILFNHINQGTCGATCFVHEFGHYFLNYTSNSLALDEFCSTCDEALYYAYLANKMDKNSSEYTSFINHITERFLASAIEASYIDEFTYSIHYMRSAIADKYYDGISDDELVDFIKDLNAKYGYKEDNTYIINKALNYMLFDTAYNISYANNYVITLTVFYDALNNYETNVNNYLNFLNNPQKDSKTGDYYVPTLKANNFMSPFDENTFIFLENAIKEINQ